ncbi:hypothetical protein OPT61_g1416 [Boeremia exigua]|uniref:Uncharacterized protein n=1 Tax=Boeremia exigua TaxID=749465 RepID=A0ACC2IQI3_9PLEO|nr:hypothetical protein OPT61_g1416 [Boeremia exigua]
MTTMSSGHYSRTALRAFRHTHNRSTSERTRSHASRRSSSAHGISKPFRRTIPSTDDFSRTQPVSKALLASAEHRLNRCRLGLYGYLTSDRWRTHSRREPTEAQIEQLGTLSSSGEILARPRVMPGTWQSESRMKRKRNKSKPPSGLRNLEQNYSEEELDEEFGVLPGETWGGEQESDDEAELDVLDGLSEDRRCEDAAREGRRVEGLWRKTVCGRLDGEVSDVVMQRALEMDGLSERMVMDPHCVEVRLRLMAIKGTQSRSSIIAATIPMIASGVQPLLLVEPGAADGAVGMNVAVDVADAIFVEGSQNANSSNERDASGYKACDTVNAASAHVEKTQGERI